MKTLARIVTRPSGDNLNSAPDLIIGACFRNQSENGLKAGRVYELREALDSFMLVDIGPSAIGITPQEGVHRVGWGSDISHILNVTGKTLVLTMDEYLNLRDETPPT
jgi:hypothetical protein